MQFCIMLKKLQQKWGVNGINMVLIITTFALGGSACARVAGWLLHFAILEKGILWWTLYVLLVSLLWPVCVFIISFPLGQHLFFKNYLSRIWSKMKGKSSKIEEKRPENSQKTAKIAIFASGKGTNAENIISYFIGNRVASVVLIVTDNPNAGVIEVAKKYNIQVQILSREERLTYDTCKRFLLENQVDFIVLAGYLKKIPGSLIAAFPDRIINIHPALLPKYGGKGMYGTNVHQAVINNNEKESGITIHVVDELYDHGKTIFQASCKIDSGETVESLAKKIHQLEYEHFPRVIAEMIQK